MAPLEWLGQGEAAAGGEGWVSGHRGGATLTAGLCLGRRSSAAYVCVWVCMCTDAHIEGFAQRCAVKTMVL